MSAPNVLDAACELALQRLHVLPCGPRQKRPDGELVPNGKDDATTDITTINRWSKRRPDMNIGVACGPSQLVVIDADIAKPKNKMTDGPADLAVHVANVGDLPITWTQDTGGGGVQFVFRAPAGVEFVGKLGKAIDIIRNGYVMVPPSIHPDTGNAYRWRAGLAPGDIPIAELPSEWIEFLRAPVHAERTATGSNATGESIFDAAASLDQRYVLECLSGSSIVNGERFAFKSTKRSKWNLLVDRGDGWEGTRNFVDANGKIAATASGTGKDDGGPNASTWLRYYRQDDKAIRKALIEHVPELARWERERIEKKDKARDDERSPSEASPTGDGVSETADPFSVEIAKALSDITAHLNSKSDTKREPMFTDGADILAAEFPLTVWAIVGLLTRLGVGIVGGEPKSTKSWMALAMALAVATGTKAFGEYQAEIGTVAYFFCEDQAKQVRNRLRSLLAGADLTLPPGRLFVQPRGKFLDITKDDDLAWLLASCRRLGKLSLLVLDPLRDLHSGEENASDSMRDVMRRLRLLGELLGCTVLCVHHTAKASETTNNRRPGQRLRGSSAVHGSLDSGMYLTETKGGDGTNLFRNYVHSEVKGARSAGLFGLELVIEDNADGEAERATYGVFRAAAKETTAKETAQLTVLQWVASLAADGIVMSRRKLRVRDDRPLSEKDTEAVINELITAKRLELKGRGGAVVLPHTNEGRTFNNFTGARGARTNSRRGGAVVRASLEAHRAPGGDRSETE